MVGTSNELVPEMAIEENPIKIDDLVAPLFQETIIQIIIYHSLKH